MAAYGLLFSAVGATTRMDMRWTGITASVGLAIGIALFFELISLRRRLDAVIALLRQGPDPRI